MSISLFGDHTSEWVEHKGLFSKDDTFVICDLFRTLHRLRLMKGSRTEWPAPRDTVQLNKHKYVLGKNACYITALT